MFATFAKREEKMGAGKAARVDEELRKRLALSAMPNAASNTHISIANIPGLRKEFVAAHVFWCRKTIVIQVPELGEQMTVQASATWTTAKWSYSAITPLNESFRVDPARLTGKDVEMIGRIVALPISNWDSENPYPRLWCGTQTLFSFNLVIPKCK